MGAFIGDSIGSGLEFRDECSTEDIDLAMQMPGNMPPWYLLAGQVTDDSELAMCQLHALSQMKPGLF